MQEDWPSALEFGRTTRKGEPMPDLPIPEEIEAFMAEANPAVVATVRSDGSPHSVPTWYEWDGGVLLLNMDRSRKRLRHLSPGSPVALSVMALSDWYSHVSFIGEVEELRDDPDLADIDRLSLRYRGKPYRDRSRDSVTALIRPSHWFTWGPMFN
jgi:PPOX class probable F420-dependent enzyme